ncbi:MAG: transposase [Hyphomonadaceae bacterium]|nr:transposase [Hyphomonadaceae bacterium]
MGLSATSITKNQGGKKPKGQPMPTHIKRANSTRSRIRALVEHPFADQKHRMGLRIRTMGLARATIKITMANMAYNLQRLIYHETQRVECARNSDYQPKMPLKRPKAGATKGVQLDP